MEKIKIKFQRINEKFSEIPLPKYETSGSAGMDIRAALDEPFTLKAGAVGLVPTGLRVEIPEGYEIQVRPRSGLALNHGIGLLNSPGTIDSDYRGEIKIIMFNFGKEDFVINSGERIAQLIVGKVYQAEVVDSDELSETSRGEGGFGHTGKG